MTVEQVLKEIMSAILDRDSYLTEIDSVEWANKRCLIVTSNDDDKFLLHIKKGSE